MFKSRLSCKNAFQAQFDKLLLYCDEQFLQDEVDGFYGASADDRELLYNNADVQLVYSTASEGEGELSYTVVNFWLQLVNVTIYCVHDFYIAQGCPRLVKGREITKILALVSRNFTHGLDGFTGSVIGGVHLELLVDHSPPAKLSNNSFWKVFVFLYTHFISVRTLEVILFLSSVTPELAFLKYCPHHGAYAYSVLKADFAGSCIRNQQLTQ